MYGFNPYMMGHRTPLKGGTEWDVFSSWRKVYCYLARPGICKAIKRQHNKRVRREATLQIRTQTTE